MRETGASIAGSTMPAASGSTSCRTTGTATSTCRTIANTTLAGTKKCVMKKCATKKCAMKKSVAKNTSTAGNTGKTEAAWDQHDPVSPRNQGQPHLFNAQAQGRA